MKLFYRRYGEGPPLFILHGLYGSSDNWVTIAKNISNYFTVYLPDQRNHGQSPHSEVHDYQTMSSDLYELASDLGLSKFFLAGHSMGGKTALMYAMRWPEMIEGLLVGDISPFTDETRSKAAHEFHSAILKTLVETDISKAETRNDVEILLSEKIQSVKIRGLLMKNLQRTSDNKFTWRLNASSLAKNLDRILEGLSTEMFNNLQVTGFPVIFLKGERSGYLSAGEFKEILKVFPSAELKIIENAGHWIQADNPEAVTMELINLLNY